MAANELETAAIPTPDMDVVPTEDKGSKAIMNELGLERGSSGTKLFGGMIYEEYNSKLMGQRGLQIYEEMRRSDAQVQATLLAMELPIRSTLWYVEAGETTETAGEKTITDQDYEIAAFVEEALFARMEITFDEFIRQTLTMLPFGYSIFEKVYKEEGGKIYVKKLAQRLARTVWQWKRNESGLPGIVQFVPMNDDRKSANIFIPAEKLLVFSYRKEGDNFEGVSVLRSSYKHWYIKDTLYKLDAVKHERQAIGIPVITMPDTHNEADAIEAETILANLRATEKNYVVLPGEKWKFEFANMGSGSVVDCEKSIAHHNREIAKNILAQFLELGAGEGGSYALSEDQSSLFMLSLTAIAKQIAEKLNRELIPELVDLNFDIAENQSYPKICFNKLGEVDYTKLSSALSTLASAGMITPDEDLEDHIRKVFDLPKKSEEENEGEEMPEDGIEEEDTSEMDTAADEMDAEDAATQAEADTAATPEEDAAAAETELASLESELKSLEASELGDIAINLAESFSENEIGVAMFRAPVDEETKKKISEALQEYWKRRGKKTPDDLKKAGATAKTRADSAKTKISETTDAFKKSIAPLKSKLDEIRKLKESIPAGKRDPKTRAKIRDMAREVRAQIAKIKGEKDVNVAGLRSIRVDALNTEKALKSEIKARKKAIDGVIKGIREQLKAENATRSASIRSLADHVRANVDSAKSVMTQAKAQAEGKSKTEKAQIMKNAKALVASIRGENETLRVAARKIRDESRSERDKSKAKADTVKKAAGFSIEEAQALGFSDPDDMKAFLDTKHLFDPRVILNVQAHG